MLEYFSVETFDSKVCPGVSYKLRKMSKGRRSSFNLAVAGLLAKKAALQQQIAPISEEIERAEQQAKSEPCSCMHLLSRDLVSPKFEQFVADNPTLEISIVDDCHSSVTRRCMVEGCNCREPKPDPKVGGYEKYRDLLNQLVEIESEEIGPKRLSFFVSEIQGLKIDGVNATPESLISDGPEILVNEISAELNKLLTLSPDEALGFKRPITGGAAMVGQPSTITVP